MARSKKGSDAFTVTLDVMQLSSFERAQLENSGTGHVREISPLWRAPRDDTYGIGSDQKPVRIRAEFDPRYHTAIYLLKNQICPDLSEHEATGFFCIRDEMVHACEKWRYHDWEKDRTALKERRLGEKSRPKLAKATKQFRDELANSAFGSAYQKLGLQLALSLIPDAKIQMTYQDGVGAISRALEQFEIAIARGDTGPIRYGPLEYGYLPRSFPSWEIALAIVLADIFARTHRGQHQNRSIDFGRPAKFSPQTPWNAIYEFAFAGSNLLDVSGSVENIQRLVQSNAKNVARIYP